VNRQRLPDGTLVVTMGDPRTYRMERRIGRVTLALLVIWLGVMAIVTEPAGMTAIGSGVILLGSGLYRKFAGGRAGLVTWVLGVILIGVGIGDATSHAHVNWWGITAVIVGVWLLAGAVRRSF
jgi:hypothetical protein